MAEFAEELEGQELDNEVFNDAGCSPQLMYKHEKLLTSILREVKKLNSITINNGDDGKTPVTFEREDYYQQMYNRSKQSASKDDVKGLEEKIKAVDEKTSAKHMFNAASSFSDKFYKIAQFVILLATLWYAFNANKKETELETKVKMEQLKEK